MTYTINNNTARESLEITFDCKPSDAIRSALKENGFRWHAKNAYWYGRADEAAIRAILDGEATQAEPLPTQKNKTVSSLPSLWERTRTDSIPEHDTRLDTKTICSEVRAHLKARFPECKFSVRKTGYSSICATIEAAPYSREWIPEDTEAVRQYGYIKRFCAHWEDSPALAAVLAYCEAYLQSYNYDNSDIMSDYFDVNFYGDFRIASGMEQLTPSPEVLADLADFDRCSAEQAEKEAAEAEEAAARAAIEAEAARIAYEEAERINAEAAERIISAVEIRDIPEEAQYIVCDLDESCKACTIDEVREDIRTRENPSPAMKAIVSREIYFSDSTRDEFDAFCLMLLHDFPFLSGFGGSRTFDVRVNEENMLRLNQRQNSSVTWYSCNCVAVYFNGLLQFVIDPQGYDYARYVLIPRDNSCTVRISARYVEERETARTETLPPFYFPAALHEQAENASPRIGTNCTLFYIDPDLCMIRRASGKLMKCTPCKWAQYNDALCVTLSGCPSIYLTPRSSALLFAGDLPDVPRDLLETDISDRLVRLNYAGSDALDTLIRIADHYDLPTLIDTIQR